MERHLIKQRTSYVMSLPIAWVRKHHLQGGASLTVTAQKEGLLITAPSMRAEESIEIAFDAECSDVIWMKMIAAYVSGYTNIALTFARTEVPFTKTKEKRAVSVQQLLSDMATQFVGMELFERTATKGVFRNLLIEGQKELDNALQRMFYVIKEMLKETIETREYLGIIEMDISVNRLKNFCLRMLNMYPQQQQSFLLKLVDGLEQLADGIVVLLRYCVQHPPTPQLLKRCGEVLALFTRTHAGYASGDLNEVVVATKQLARELTYTPQDLLLLRLVDMLTEVQEAIVGIGLEKT